MKPGRPSRGGFVLPAILFGLVVMSILATAALRTANDGAASVRSFRESGLALFVADAGLRQTMGNWPNAVRTLAGGDSIDLGWQTLSNRGRYRAVIYAVHNGVTQSYTVVVRARGAGKLAGQNPRSVKSSEFCHPMHELTATVLALALQVTWRTSKSSFAKPVPCAMSPQASREATGSKFDTPSAPTTRL